MTADRSCSSRTTPRSRASSSVTSRDMATTVAVAGSVAQAEEWLRAVAATPAAEQPGLVLLDINLPDEAGWALLRSDAFAAAGSPPVVVVTATTLSPRHLREYGVAGCLPKPFAMETLRSTIDRLMRPEDPR